MTHLKKFLVKISAEGKHGTTYVPKWTAGTISTTHGETKTSVQFGQIFFTALTRVPSSKRKGYDVYKLRYASAPNNGVLNSRYFHRDHDHKDPSWMKQYKITAPKYYEFELKTKDRTASKESEQVKLLKKIEATILETRETLKLNKNTRQPSVFDDDYDEWCSQKLVLPHKVKEADGPLKESAIPTFIVDIHEDEKYREVA